MFTVYNVEWEDDPIAEHGSTRNYRRCENWMELWECMSFSESVDKSA
jgi:hypothetical protein